MKSTIPVLLSLILLVPAAAASHWTLYYAGLDRSAGDTAEDDGAIFTVPGSSLEGRANHVTFAGTHPGDGSLFLDARIGARAGTLDLYAGRDLALAIGHRDAILPGQFHASAWYGWWNDLDLDGAIDDVHDSADDAADEFKWRGIASDESGIAVVLYASPPSSTKIAISLTPDSLNLGSAFVSAYANRSSHMQALLQDATSMSNAEQGWNGATPTSTDASLLTSVQTLVVAGARAAPGSRLGYDLDDPNALEDVDHYESVSSDVELLWLAAVDDASDAGAVIIDALGPVVETYGAVVGAAGGVTAMVSEASGDTGGFTGRQITPPDSKEPNTALDDFGGRATFGGVGDHLGSGNGYSEYASGWHFYYDNLARTFSCIGASVTVPGSTVSESVAPCFGNVAPLDVAGAQGPRARSSSVGLHFEGQAYLWYDVNGDTHLGAVCEPESDDFDATRNTCKSAPYPWPHSRSTEVISACPVLRERGIGIVEVTPASGATWSNAVLARDARYPNRLVETLDWRVLTGTETVSLRLSESCVGSTMRTRDALLFLSGDARIPLIVETTVSIGGFKDTGLGVDVGVESVRDVDHIPAAL